MSIASSNRVFATETAQYTPIAKLKHYSLVASYDRLTNTFLSAELLRCVRDNNKLVYKLKTPSYTIQTTLDQCFLVTPQLIPIPAKALSIGTHLAVYHTNPLRIEFEPILSCLPHRFAKTQISSILVPPYNTYLAEGFILYYAT